MHILFAIYQKLGFGPLLGPCEEKFSSENREGLISSVDNILSFLEYSNDESKGEDFPEEVKGIVYQCVNLKGKGRER